MMWKGVSGYWKPLLKGAAIPAFLIFAFLIKNYALFGMLSTSSWMGPNLLMMTKYIPYSVRDGLYLKGKFSPYVAVGSFAPLEEYEK